MRFLVLACLLLTRCAPDPAGSSSDTTEADVPAAGAAFTIAIDSLVLAEDSLRYRVAIGYPQLRGSAGEPMSATLRSVNMAVQDSVEALARDFRPETPPPGQSPEYPVRIEGSPTRSFVSDEVLSVVVGVTAFTGGADANLVLLPLTYDLRTGQALDADDLFEPGTRWPDTLAAWTERGVLVRLARSQGISMDRARAGFFAEGLNRVRAGQVAVTMGKDSLRVHIPPYQVTSQAGAFDIGVPYPIVAPLARPGSVLARRARR